MQAKIEQAAPVDTDKIVKQILDLCAAMPAVNRTLCTHYLENEPWQAAISELRAEMDNYRPAIHAFVLAETNEAIEQQWSRFAHDKLEPLRDTIFDQSETIAYVITYVDSAYHEQLQTLTCYLQATRKRKGQLLFRCGGHDKAVWAKRPAPSEAAGETT